jgi:hypothetical protein
MGYERYPRGTQPGDYYNRSDDMDYDRDYGSGRDYSYSSARDYEAAGEIGGREGSSRGNRGYYGGRQMNQRQRGGGYDRNYGEREYGARDYGQSDYHGSYAHDGRRFEDVGRNRHADDDNYRGSRGAMPQRGRSMSRQPEGYDYDERGFFDRAGDEVRSWFGDDEAERRREMDARNDARYYGDRYANSRDADYHDWRRGQIDALDRDYDEYRRENQSKFHSEFSSWRTSRQEQRNSLGKVEEHAEVVGSDGEHVGTVDKVRGDRILLTKNDKDAGGIHHSIPSSWIDSADAGKVTLTKSAADTKQSWRDEERSQAMFGYGDNARDRTRSDTEGHNLNKSFSGTY